MPKTIKILSIDGGGIRGIIPAMILAEIEERTGRPISGMFDLIAGTSTGGILALGLTKPGTDNKPAYKAQDLLRLYETEGATIFSRSVWHRIRALGNLVEEKYPAEGIEYVLAQYFGDVRLKDALTEVIVTSYEIERRMPFFFKTHYARTKAGFDFPMMSVARATSAAPTYFEPFKLETENGSDYYALIDGGVYANNPSVCAYAEAIRIFPDANDFMMVSLGTGELTRRISYGDARGWGLAHWAQPLLNVVFDGVSDTTDYQMKQLLPPTDNRQRYFRFQVRLDEGSDDLDDASRTNIRVLKLLADDIIRSNNEVINEICERLK